MKPLSPFHRVPFWRFLITGADQNRELKMWCTVSWTCLQTIRWGLRQHCGGGGLFCLSLLLVLASPTILPS